MRSFRKLSVWSKSHHLTLRVYEVTRSFPKDERYGLTSQIRRAAASVPTNIAEGCGRSSLTDFARFLDIAAGSLSEVEYLLLLSRDLSLLSNDDFQPLISLTIETRKMLASYTKRVRQTAGDASRPF